MKRIFLLLTCSLFIVHLHAQHHNMPAMKDTTKKPMQDTVMDMKGMAMDSMNMDVPMTHMLSLNLPMMRNGSGTAWLPDASPMYAYMLQSKKWMYMIHGNVFIRYNKQDIGNKGTRGDEQFGSVNWAMFMAQRKVGSKGLFHFATMLSLDRITEGGSGYPLLFQTGESWKNKPLIDRQHPHDLVSELAVSYSYSFSQKSDLSFYFGYPGEPSVGSVAFMHRPSALSNPDAPISHHWNDGTHITFGVATIGYRFSKFKIEASSFTGREPDENRFNFDKPRFDSWSGRLSFNPSTNWALQVSHAYVKSPEQLNPTENIYRTTASAIASFPFQKNGTFNATALWGLNQIQDGDAQNAFLFEASSRWDKLVLFTRYEWVQKSTEELGLNQAVYGDALLPINALTLGFNYDLFKAANTRFAVGSHFNFYSAPSKLDNLYGTSPKSFEAYIRIYPDLMKMH